MRTRPLTLAALGVAAVALDPRVVAWDLLPDTLGWALVAAGAWRLSLTPPFVLAIVASIASLAEAQLPYHYDALDPITGEVVLNVAPGQSFDERLAFDAVSGVRLALLAVGVGAGAAGLCLMLRALARRAEASSDAPAVRHLRRLAWAVTLGWATPYLAVVVGQTLLDDDGFDPVWNGAWELPAMVGIGAMVAVALQFATTSNRRWSASGDELGSPWAELMVRDIQPDDH